MTAVRPVLELNLQDGSLFAGHKESLLIGEIDEDTTTIDSEDTWAMNESSIIKHIYFKGQQEQHKHTGVKKNRT